MKNPPPPSTTLDRRRRGGPARLGDIAEQVAAALAEEAHHALMRLYDQTGQPAAGLRQYRELERILEGERGRRPASETRALAQQLELKAQVPPRPSPAVGPRAPA